MMCLNNKNNKMMDALIINKNAWLIQAKKNHLHVIFLFIYMCKNSIFKALKTPITKGGKKANEKTFTPHLCFTSFSVESRAVKLANLVSNIRLEDVAGNIRPSHSRQREPRNLKMGREPHSLATQEIASYLSIHRFDLSVKLEESL